MTHSSRAALAAGLDRLFQRTAYGIRPGLDIIRRLSTLLGDPQTHWPCIHVAGTNGKGSVCAMIESVLRQSGVRTGLYTSPHLVRFNERIQVDGEPISDEELIELIAIVEEAALKLEREEGLRPATFFECATGIAFEYFRRRGVQCAVIETGMGGRWDATNIVRPLVTVITRIDVDHVNYLGPELIGIAAEKAGIIKPGVPVVTGAMPDEARAIIVKEAHDVESTLIRADERVGVRRVSQGLSMQKIKFETDQRAYPPVRLPLIGQHQLENVALAVAALEALSDRLGADWPEQAMKDGLEKCHWPARAQLIEKDPPVLLDVAHNPNGAAALAALLDEVAPKQPRGLIVGFLKDKDGMGLMKRLAGHVDRCWAVEIASKRGESVANVVACARAAGLPIEASTLDLALPAARAWAQEHGGLVCIAGSLYLAGEVLRRLESGEGTLCP